MRFIHWLLIIIGAFGLGVIIFNFLIMPWIIGRGKEVIVPNLIGKSLIEAQKILEAQNLALGKTEEIFDTIFPIGYVVQQKPKPGSIVKPGRPIILYLSKGTRKIKVPFLLQMPLERAMTILSNIGLIPTSIETIRSITTGQGKVIGIEPEPGSEISLGTPIKLLVSGGPAGAFLMPNFVGVPINIAIDSVVKCGLVIGTIQEQEVESEAEAGMVVIQYPEDGMRVKTGDTIKLIVGKRAK
ncbi:MAG: PASTA domain-containing protein [candidate division WOR-3 bacterium]|nr:PASTA domain-containing protein [candidate division WOR-3 bacterium]